MWSKQHLTRSPSLHLQRVLVLDHLVLELSHLFTCSLLISCVFLHTSFCRISVFSLLGMFSYALSFSLSFSVFLEDFPLSFLFHSLCSLTKSDCITLVYSLFSALSFVVSVFLCTSTFSLVGQRYFSNLFSHLNKTKNKKGHTPKNIQKEKRRKHTYIHIYIYI